MSRREKEGALLLLEERERRLKEDPLYLWEPTDAQKPFIGAVTGHDSYENWMFAANRSGKSDGGAWCAARFARYGLPGEPFRPTTGWLVSLDFPSSRDIVQPKLFDNGVAVARSHAPFIPEREIKDWRVSDQLLILKNGSVLGFKSADSGRAKFQGTERDYVWFDEEPPKEIYDECVIRVGGGSRMRIFGTCTLLPPEGQLGGVSWAYTELVQPWTEGKGRARIFTASIYDNPYIDRAEIARLEGIYPEGSPARRIRLGGELLPGLSGSRAYPAFDRRLNVCKQPPLAFRRPMCWMWDFNVEPMVCLVGQRDGELFRVYREFVMDEGNIPDMVQMFREAYPKHGAEIYLYGDATGKGRTAQTGQSDYTTILQHMRSYGAPVRMRIPEANPAVPDRVNAMNHACKDETGSIRLLLDESCKETMIDLEQVLRDPRGGIKKTTNRRDPYFRRTHLSDALGYWVSYDEPVVIAHEPTYRRVAGRVPTPSYAFSKRG